MTTLHVTSNLAKENSYAQVLADGMEIAAHFGTAPAVWRVEECETWGHVRALELVAARHGLLIFWPGGHPARGRKPNWRNACPILFTAEHFTMRSPTSRLVLAGVRFGWPNRCYNRCVLAKHGSVDQAAAVTHFIQQAFTKHRERRAKWARQMRRVTRLSRVTASRGIPTVGGSDFNRDKARVPGARMVFTTHGTHGSAHYDGFWLMGPVGKVIHQYRIPLRSDHDAVFVLIED